MSSVLVCHSYVTRILYTRIPSVCHSYVLVCHPYVTRMYSYVIHMSLLCTRMSSICHSYVLVCHPYVTRIYSYVIRMSLVCTHMSSVCHSCVIPMSLVCGFSMNLKSLSFTFIRFRFMCYLLTFIVPLVVIRCHSLSLIVIHCHSWTFVVPLVVTRCLSLYLSLSLDVPFVFS